MTAVLETVNEVGMDETIVIKALGHVTTYFPAPPPGSSELYRTRHAQFCRALTLVAASKLQDHEGLFRRYVVNFVQT